jgi:hypothetical protein
VRADLVDSDQSLKIRTQLKIPFGYEIRAYREEPVTEAISFATDLIVVEDYPEGGRVASHLGSSHFICKITRTEPSTQLMSFLRWMGPIIPAVLALITGAWPLIYYLITGQPMPKCIVVSTSNAYLGTKSPAKWSRDYLDNRSLLL